MTRARALLPAVAATLAAGVLAPPALGAWSRLSPPLNDPAALISNVQVVPGADGRVLIAWMFAQASGYGGQAGISVRPGGLLGPRQTFGVTLTAAGTTPRYAGTSWGVSAMSPFGGHRWIGVDAREGGLPYEHLEWWEGTTTGRPRLGGRLSVGAWETGATAVSPDGAAVLAWTAPKPRVVMVVHRGAAGRPFSAPRRLSSGTATDVRAARAGRTVVVAWQRRGAIEARLSRDGGATFGAVRRLGPSPEAFPGLTVRVSTQGRALVFWGARDRAEARAAFVYRLARSRPGGTFATTLIERTPAVEVPFAVADRYGPGALAVYAGRTPVIAWQGVENGQIVARVQRVDGGAPVTLRGATPVVEDLVAAPGGAAELAWRTADGVFVSHVPAAGQAGPAERTPAPGTPETRDVRLAVAHGGLVAAWITGTTVLTAARIPFAG